MVTWPARPDLRDGTGADDREILRSRIDLSTLPRLSRAVTERVICATGDFGYATDLICTEESLGAGVAALAAGVPVVADVPMVAAGISGRTVICTSEEPLTQRLARTAGIDAAAAAAAVRMAIGAAGTGALWIVGAAEQAIYEIISREVEPAMVIATPAGLADATEAKSALRCSGLPTLTNVSAKGGPAVAVAGCQALIEAIPAAPPPRRAGARTGVSGGGTAIRRPPAR
jgi:precorrin-8X/cobalt-precorrin-8 methylmutase